MSEREIQSEENEAVRETLYRGILDAFVANTCVVDREGRIVAVNRAWNRFAEQHMYSGEWKGKAMLGETEEEAYGLGMNYFTLCAAAADENIRTAAAAAAGLKQILSGEREKFSLEYPCHSPEKQRWFLMTISPLTSDEGGAIISHFDITEQTELRQANQTLDAFAQSLALAFRTPLGLMRGSLNALLEAEGSLPVELQEHIRQVAEGTECLDSMVRDLLSYSLISRSTVVLRPTDLQRAVSDALQRHNTEIRKSNAQIAVVEPLPYVSADPVLLTETLSCLISNALKFRMPGTHPELSIRTENRPEAIWLWIEDCGIGIEEKERETLYTIFKRSSRTAQYPGNGIGLAIVEKSMKQMKGVVEIMPAEEKGTRIKLVFPKKMRPEG